MHRQEADQWLVAQGWGREKEVGGDGYRAWLQWWWWPHLMNILNTPG